MKQWKAGSPYGNRTPPSKNASSFHRGADYSMVNGSKNNPIYSPADGIVAKISNHPSGGNTMYINHDDPDNVSTPYQTRYAHIQDDSAKVKVGDKVKQGQHIANTGNTGDASTGDHLHFGTYTDDTVHTNPQTFLDNGMPHPLDKPKNESPQDFNNFIASGNDGHGGGTHASTVSNAGQNYPHDLPTDLTNPSDSAVGDEESENQPAAQGDYNAQKNAYTDKSYYSPTMQSQYNNADDVLPDLSDGYGGVGAVDYSAMPTNNDGYDDNYAGANAQNPQKWQSQVAYGSESQPPEYAQQAQPVNNYASNAAPNNLPPQPPENYQYSATQPTQQNQPPQKNSSSITINGTQYEFGEGASESSDINNLYIWQTQEDDKVRQSHKDNDNMVFDRTNPPSQTGNAGDDYGCRCVMKPVV